VLSPEFTFSFWPKSVLLETESVEWGLEGGMGGEVFCSVSVSVRVRVRVRVTHRDVDPLPVTVTPLHSR